MTFKLFSMGSPLSVGSPLALLLWFAFVTPNASAEIVEYSSGHADIGVEYEAGSGELETHWHFGSNAVLNGVSGNEIEYEPGGAYARVADATRNDFSEVPAGFGFTGLTPGQPGSIWVLPQSNTPGLPFLGIAAEEVGPSSDWSGDISWALTSVSRPAGGEFSLWQSGGLGGIDVLMATADGIDSSVDRFSTSVGGHDHYNFGFSQEGVYDVTLTASGTHVSDGLVSGSGTFKFVVGSATAVPEAGTASLLALGSLGLLVGGFHQRRRRGTSPQPAA